MERERVRAIIVAELERRLRVLETSDESAFGRFTPWDWAACLAAFVVLPLIMAVWFA